jgi:hypothetical protein
MESNTSSSSNQDPALLEAVLSAIDVDTSRGYRAGSVLEDDALYVIRNYVFNGLQNVQKWRKLNPPHGKAVSFRKVALTCDDLDDSQFEVWSRICSAVEDNVSSLPGLLSDHGIQVTWAVYVHRHTMKTADGFATFRDSAKAEVRFRCRMSGQTLKVNRTYVP